MSSAPTTQRRPLRIAKAGCELLAAVALSALAWWCWHRGIVLAAMRRGMALNRIDGRWWATAVGAATLAGIQVLDGGRRMTAQTSRQYLR